MLINATTNYVPQQTQRVNRNVGKVENNSSFIRLSAYTMVAMTFAYIGLKVIVLVGI